MRSLAISSGNWAPEVMAACREPEGGARWQVQERSASVNHKLKVSFSRKPCRVLIM